MNLLEALKYPFNDDRWLNKSITAMLLLFIPVFGWFVLMGYGLRVVRRAADGDWHLPDWHDFGRDFNNGLLVFIGSLVYAIPLVLFACLGSVAQSLGGNEAGILLICCGGPLFFAYVAVVTPLLYSAIAQYTFTRDFADFFNIPERIHDASSHSEQAVILILLSVMLWILLAIPMGLWTLAIVLLFSEALLGCLCLVIFLVPGAYMFTILTLSGYHLAGQWARVIDANRFVRR